jgi:hypothetical protein
MDAPMKFAALWMAATSVTLVAAALALGQTGTRAPALQCGQGDAGRPEYRQLDFWIGEWSVMNGDKKVSEVTVEPILKGCALAETWNANNVGKAMATFNPEANAWEYFWVTDRGRRLYFTQGTMSQNEMRFSYESTQAGGEKRSHHWSLFNLPDGRVRELDVWTTDGGKTWNTGYDYYWSKKSH